MSTNYSLICWGGRAGKTCTISNASPAVVTLNNHGIRDNLAGKGVYFTTDGALPTGITADTVYYARRNDDNTFHLYDTEAHAADTGSTTGIINTSSAGSGTHTVRGAYYKNLTTEQKARYGASGSERIYGNLYLYQTDRLSAGLTVFDDEIIEAAEDFLDVCASGSLMSLALGCFSVTLTSMVNGVRSDAFHSGVVGDGYMIQTPTTAQTWDLLGSNTTIDGITYYQPANTRYGLRLSMINQVFKNNIVIGYSAGTNDWYGVWLAVAGSKVFNNIIVGSWTNSLFIAGGNAGRGCVVCNNTVVSGVINCRISTDQSSDETSICNNLSLDASSQNYTDSAVDFTKTIAMWQNAGESGDTIWTQTGADNIETTTAVFEDFSTLDLRPKIDSAIVGTGIVVRTQEQTDILGKSRIQKISVTQEFSYDNLSGSFDSWSIISWGTGGTAGTGRLVEVTEVGTAGTMGLHLISGVAPTDGLEITDGTATCDVDGTVTTGERWVDSPGCSIGAFEYDYGAPPPATTITLSANVSLAGAEVRIYENASGDYIGDEVVGTESNPDSTYAFEYPSGDTVVIQILKSGYVEYIQAITVPESDFTLPISLVADINA